MEAQSKDMKTELFQYLKNPLYWAVIGLGLSFRTVLAYFDRLYREPQFWELAADFWNKTGSVTVGLLILLVVIHRFSYDVEVGVFPVINSTAYLPLLTSRHLVGKLSLSAPPGVSKPPASSCKQGPFRWAECSHAGGWNLPS